MRIQLFSGHEYLANTLGFAVRTAHHVKQNPTFVVYKITCYHVDYLSLFVIECSSSCQETQPKSQDETNMLRPINVRSKGRVRIGELMENGRIL